MVTKLGTFQDACSEIFYRSSCDDQRRRRRRRWGIHALIVAVFFAGFLFLNKITVAIQIGSLSHIIHLFRPNSYRWSKSYNSIMYSNRNLINFIGVPVGFVGGNAVACDGKAPDCFFGKRPRIFSCHLNFIPNSNIIAFSQLYINLPIRIMVNVSDAFFLFYILFSLTRSRSPVCVCVCGIACEIDFHSKKHLRPLICFHCIWEWIFLLYNGV